MRVINAATSVAQKEASHIVAVVLDTDVHCRPALQAALSVKRPGTVVTEIDQAAFRLERGDRLFDQPLRETVRIDHSHDRLRGRAHVMQAPRNVAPTETALHRRVDPFLDRGERARNDKSGDHDGYLRSLAGIEDRELLGELDDADKETAQDAGDDHVDDRPTDDPVDVEQPMAQDRDPDRDRDTDKRYIRRSQSQ